MRAGKHLGAYVRGCREQDGLNIRQLAERLDVSRQTVWEIEMGRRPLSPVMVELLFDALPSMDRRTLLMEMECAVEDYHRRALASDMEEMAALKEVVG